MMRKLIVMAMVAGWVAAGGFAKVASAGVTLDLLFTEVNGGAITPTNTLAVVAPGDELKMVLVMRNDVGLSGHSFSINYDLDGQNQLDVVSRHNWVGIAMNKGGTKYVPFFGAFSPTTETFVGSWNSTNGASTNLLLLPAAGAFAGGYTIGTVVWKVNAGTGDNSASAVVGYLNPGVDGLGGSGFNNISTSALFHGATIVNVVPEPGTAALIGFGLVGLVLAGRRNRA
jgi:hypothetical protein